MCNSLAKRTRTVVALFNALKSNMKMKRFPGLPLLLCVLPLTAAAQQSEPPIVVETPKEPVVISDYQSSPDAPQIIIRPGDNEVFYEYRVNGELVEIKVVPAVGPSSYLVPAEGGWIREEQSQTLIPSWVIFRW